MSCNIFSVIGNFLNAMQMHAIQYVYTLQSIALGEQQKNTLHIMRLLISTHIKLEVEC